MAIALERKKSIIFILIFNLIIALGFYWDNSNSGYSVLASDVHSIIPIAQKFDDPTLFKHDLFLNTLDNVKYYTPFFVQPLRFVAGFVDNNYLEAIKILNVISHILFGLLWYLLFFKISRNFWIALIMSVVIRGLVWLPGFEIWGISDIWTVLPRTIYITLLPIPFLVLSFTDKYRFLLSALLLGLIFNFHPITGLGGILIFILFFGLVVYFFKKEVNIPLKIMGLSFIALLLGMLPFVFTYFTKTDIVLDYDTELYKKAFFSRIPKSFEKPFEYLKQWMALKTLFFAIPLFGYLLMSLKRPKEFKKSVILIIISVVVLLVSSSSIYLENVINNRFGLNIRMAFQFIRLQKLAILPAYFAMAFILMRLNIKKRILPAFFVGFMTLLVVCKAPFFNNVPLLGDDIFRAIIPDSLSLMESKKERFTKVDKMMEFIADHTNKDDVFYGPPIIRCSAKRSVVMDYKGASAIIEGNPKQFIQWYLDRQQYGNLDSMEEKLMFLKSQKKVDYILTTKPIQSHADLVYQVDDLLLYKLND